MAKQQLVIDYIGGANYPDVISDHHPEGYGGRFLGRASGWGQGIHAARALARTGKAPVIGMHGLWRDSHRFTQREIEPAVIQATKFARLHSAFPRPDKHFSPWLEADPRKVSVELMQECMRECRKVLPRKIVLVSSGIILPRRMNEVHHSPPVNSPYIYSFDGLHMFDADVDFWLHWHRYAKYFGLWCYQCNGKRHLHDTTPRSQRTNYLKKRHIDRMVRMST